MLNLSQYYYYYYYYQSLLVQTTIEIAMLKSHYYSSSASTFPTALPNPEIGRSEIRSSLFRCCCCCCCYCCITRHSKNQNIDLAVLSVSDTFCRLENHPTYTVVSKYYHFCAIRWDFHTVIKDALT
jgi:hypothetical protein